MARQELRPDDVTCIIDTREQLPLDLSPMKTKPGTLPTGDYSVLGLENLVAIERKSLSDYLGVVGGGRERFEREAQRLLAYPVRAIVVEAAWAELECGQWRNRLSSAQVIGSTLGWIAAGIPVVLPGSRQAAQSVVGRLLFLAARRYWRIATSFSSTLRLA